jgi:hypothetical protein
MERAWVRRTRPLFLIETLQRLDGVWELALVYYLIQFDCDMGGYMDESGHKMGLDRLMSRDEIDLKSNELELN